MYSFGESNRMEAGNNQNNQEQNNTHKETTWINDMKKRHNDWNNIHAVYKMMADKFDEIHCKDGEYDKEKMEEQMKEMRAYANRSNELLQQLQEETEEKIRNNEPIEEVDYAKIEEASTMIYTKGMGWNDFKKVNEMILNLEIAIIFAREPRNANIYTINLNESSRNATLRSGISCRLHGRNNGERDI